MTLDLAGAIVAGLLFAGVLIDLYRTKREYRNYRRLDAYAREIEKREAEQSRLREGAK